jgi:hypothetical protein
MTQPSTSDNLRYWAGSDVPTLDSPTVERVDRSHLGRSRVGCSRRSLAVVASEDFLVCRGMVGGQEDMITDIALDLAAATE